MGADPSASSSHLARAHPSSSTPRTRGVDAVAACTLAATSRTRDDTPCTRGIPDLNDNISLNDESLSSPLNDSFVRLVESEKNKVVKFLAVEKRVPVAVLRKMAPYHQGLRARMSSEKRKSADALRADFAMHQCTNTCLVLHVSRFMS